MALESNEQMDVRKGVENVVFFFFFKSGIKHVECSRA